MTGAVVVRARREGGRMGGELPLQPVAAVPIA